MDNLPVFLRLEGRSALVVGDGPVALRKTGLLLKVGANVTVVAERPVPGLLALAHGGTIDLQERAFQAADLQDRSVVFVATDDDDLAVEVSEACQDRALPVNAADRLELCSFIMPSIVDRSPIVAAVSSGGVSPVMARLIRARLETLIPASFGRLAALAGEHRDAVKSRFEDQGQRRAFWERVLQGPIAELVYAGKEDQARAALAQALIDPAPTVAGAGEVYLVGAGPGDPDLLTFRALRLMQQADVVVHDRLVAPAILDLARRDAERIYAGKERDDHALPQEDINQLLVRLAREGKRVLRLKGGDPFIFGRGGEEIETLAEEGIAFQVVPGITAASGCAAYAGIPLTHREHAQSCVFVTGHLRDGRVNLDWQALVQPNQTIVIYMGLLGLADICGGLIDHGLDPATPAALVEKGTTAAQVVHTGTVGSLPARVAERNVRAPTLIIVGRVVTLREKLRWFHPHPDPGSTPVSETGHRQFHRSARERDAGDEP
jgi:uroporphyrin-III C-methyltransferase/precorrin-2 dehydrogenase/sirohydrochlorin ferrochelatase